MNKYQLIKVSGEQLEVAAAYYEWDRASKNYKTGKMNVVFYNDNRAPIAYISSVDQIKEEKE